MRPNSIVLFERITWLSLALGILNTVISFDRIRALTAQLNTTAIIAMQAMVVGLMLLLIWFIARRASVVAKWIWVVFAGVGVLMAIVNPPPTLTFGPVVAAITIVQYGLSLLACWFLFQPDAMQWFRGERGADPGIFS